YAIIQRYTPEVVPALRAARQQHGEIGFDVINRLHVPLALAAMVLLPVLLLAAANRPELARLRMLAATVAASILINATVCGALSNPHDRYGARLAWLAPLTILLAPISVWVSEAEANARRRRAFLADLAVGAGVQDAPGA